MAIHDLYKEICSIIKVLPVEGLPTTRENIVLSSSLESDGQWILDHMEQEKLIYRVGDEWLLTPRGTEFAVPNTF